LAGDRDHIATELDRVWSGHAADPSTEDLVLAGKSQLNPGQTRLVREPL
jgi:hypothetical protein